MDHDIFHTLTRRYADNGSSRVCEKSRLSIEHPEEDEQTCRILPHIQARALQERDKIEAAKLGCCVLDWLLAKTFLDTHALPCYHSQESGRPLETRAPFTWARNKGSRTTGLVSTITRDTRGGPTHGVRLHGLVRGRAPEHAHQWRPRPAGRGSYSKRGVPGPDPMHSCVQRQPPWRPGLVGEGEGFNGSCQPGRKDMLLASYTYVHSHSYVSTGTRRE
jgi:hypothetical protein